MSGYEEFKEAYLRLKAEPGTTLEKIAALQHKGTLSDIEDNLLDSLFQDRDFEVAQAIPRPTCCKAAQDYPAVTYQVDVYHDEGKHGWEAHLHSRLVEIFGSLGPKYYEDRPVAKFCPYCGTTLPEMMLDKTVKVCVVTDGVDYCDTCNQRLRACLCDPPSAAYKPLELPDPV